MSEASIDRWLVLLAAAALVSCAAPKAVVVAEDAGKTVEKTEAVEVAAQEPERPHGVRTAVRLPANFTAMPDDSQFRSKAAEEPESSPSPVIARPPSDPVIPPDIGPKPE